jgi:hypothetical protein
MLRLQNDTSEVTIMDDPNYSSGPADGYGRVYSFGDSSYMMSQHAVECRQSDGVTYSCILLGDGGMSGVHAHSGIRYQDLCLVAVGRHLVALRVPELDLVWSTEVDTATCFGIYCSPKHDCLISHGECEIARVAKSGEIVWWSSGKDIFTNGFRLREDTIEVVDFNDEVYEIEVATGKNTLVSAGTDAKGQSSGWYDKVKQWIQRRKRA